MAKPTRPKTCPKCGEEKPLDEFSSDRSKADGKQSRCRVCQAAAQRKRRVVHPEKYKRTERKYRMAHREASRAYARKRRTAHPAQYKEYKRKWNAANVEKRRAWWATRCENDPCYRLACQLRTRLHVAILGNAKTGSAVRDLGCSIEELQTYLGARFQPGMSWANHGIHGWHIDHIKPLAAFDLTDREQLLEAVHYTNLQPLWAADNLRKGARMPEAVTALVL